MKKQNLHIVAVAIALLGCEVLEAGVPNHNELWSRIFVSHVFTEKLRVEGEYQFRWQDTPGSHGLPAYRMHQGFRVWTYYQIQPAWTIGISPIAWFRSYPLINSTDDFSKPPSTELRVSGGCEWKHNFSSYEAKARINYETRLFNKDGEEDWTKKDRVRGRVMVSHSLACIDSSLSAVSVYAGDEYFFQGQDFFTTASAFDQNRIIGGIAWKICKWCKVDAMYMHIFRNSTAGDYLERVAWLNTTFYL